MRKSGPSKKSSLSARHLLAAAALGAALLAGREAAASLVWAFNAPATGNPSQNPPYPTVAVLTLTQTADGVQFTLDPNEGNPGFGSSSFVQRLDYVYSGPALSAASFRHDGGAAASFSFSGKGHMDAGYKADGSEITVTFPSSSSDRLTPGETSTWTVLGAKLSDFADTFGSANNKPSPIYADISVTGFSLPHHTPTPSNWVCPIPEPGTGALALLGLALLGRAGHRRSS